MTFWCQTFFGVDDYLVPDNSPECPLYHLGQVIQRLACQHSSGNPPIQVYQHTDAWQTRKVVFWFQLGHHDGKTKQFLMVKSSSLSAYNSILAMVAMVAVDASFRILHQPGADEKEKCQKNPYSWLLGMMHSSYMILEMSKLGLKLCCSVQSFLFSPVWCCFPNSKGTELFWVASILIFCTLFFHVFGGIKTRNQAKLHIGWLSYPLFLTSLGTLIIST